jgi:glycosyltransferase involved in cell wall biosynthesis
VRPRLAIVVSHPIQNQVPLFRCLHERGRVDLEVLFLSRHGVEPSFDEGFGRSVRYDIPLTDGYPHRFLRNWSPRPTVSRFGGVVNPGIVSALHRGGFDAVLVHGYGHVSECLALVTAALSHLPYLMVGDSRTSRRDTWREAARWRAKRALIGPIMRHATGCLAIGLLNGRYYLDLGVERARIGWSPLAVDTSFFAREGALGRTRREERLGEIGLDPTTPVALFAAKLQPRKRVLDFIAAGDELQGRVSFVVVGDGEQLEEVRVAARSRSWLKHLGFVNQHELARWYGTADVVVLPAEREPWGLVVLEALAAGTPAVVSEDVGSAPDLVEGIGRVVPVGSVSELAGGIAELVLDPDVLDASCDEMRQRVMRYSIDVQADGIERALVAS